MAINAISANMDSFSSSRTAALKKQPSHMEAAHFGDLGKAARMSASLFILCIPGACTIPWFSSKQIGNKSVAAVTVASVLPWEGFEEETQLLYFVIVSELPLPSCIPGRCCVQPAHLWYNMDSLPFVFSFRQIVSELPGSRDQIKPFQDP